MLRRLTQALAAAAILVLGAVLTAADATFVLKSGERASGQLVYRQGGEVFLVVNGRERAFSFDQIALIAFADPTPAGQEVAQLPTSDNPPELERHTLVLRDGRAIRGKLYDFTNDSRVVFDTRGGSGSVNRQSFAMSEVARLYLSASSARSLFGTSGGPTAGGSTPSGPAPVMVRVSAVQRWVDTAIDVKTGDKVSFTARGQIRINENTQVSPAGTSSVGRRGDVPVPSAPVGALVGRIERRVFVIGTRTEPVTMPAAGRLYLTVNDDDLKDNGGAFDVEIRLP